MVYFKRGDVLCIPYFPNQENSNNGTARYVLVVEDFHDGYTIIPFTKQLHQSNNYKNTILIKKDDEEGIKMGLIHDSILIIDRKTEVNLYTLTPPVIGKCSEDFLEKHNL